MFHEEARMLKKILYLFILLAVAVFISGCMVAESKYLKKEAEAVTLGKELQSLQQKHENLVAENASLKTQLDKLQQDFNGVKAEQEALSADKNKLTKDLTAVTAERDELDKVLKLKSDDLSQKIRELRGQITSLELQNKDLKVTTAQEVKAVSKTYDDLLKEMKGEVAKGQIMITELKGKLTLDVLDEILFDSGVAEIKAQGLPVLKRVVEILKKVEDKNIRIEGHTDNRKIGGALVKKYATNWELSAARATNVARYLQNQGVAPEILSAAAFGEYQPVADNATPEGRAKNRRIAIVLLPKD
jgi:chemotaxis protein MotB